MKGDTPQDSSAGSSHDGSRTPSIAGGIRHSLPKPRHNVKFTVQPADDGGPSSSHRYSLPEVRLPDEADEEPTETQPPNLPHDWNMRKDAAALDAHDKASRHANKVKRRNTSAPVSRRTSFDQSSTAVPSPHVSPMQKAHVNHPVKLDDIPLEDLGRQRTGQVFNLPEDTTSDDSDNENSETHLNPPQRHNSHHVSEARRLVRAFTNGGFLSVPGSQHRSGTATPLVDQNSLEYDYVPRPDKYKPSVLSMLLAGGASGNAHSQQSHISSAQIDHLTQKLAPFQDPSTDPRQRQADFFARNHQVSSPSNASGTQTPLESPGQTSSGLLTPRHKRPKWYKDPHQAQSAPSVGKLLESSFQAAAGPAAPAPAAQQPRHPPLRRASSGRFSLLKNPISHFRNASNTSNSTTSYRHLESIADRLASQEYIIEICKALMRYGAPTHRLEEFLSMAARKLQIQASFQYLPSCMIIAFDDHITHTTEVKLIREPTAVDLGKLMEAQQVYKDVMHECYSLQDAMDDLAGIRTRKKRYNTVTLILMYGVAAVSVGPFAFGARPIDMPISFLLGCVLGTLQLGLASRSSQFSNVFEVFGTFITSFAARGFGSIIGSSGLPIFCFSALAQSSIALILPGWIILSASLELQSRNIVAGSIRMVYAIIYTLFLGFGILIGTTIMGLIYADATNDITCHTPAYWEAGSESWRLIYTKFIWVPIFTICLAIINQAKFKQMPAMILISLCGYQVNYWSGIRFSQNIQVANALGALIIGVLANGYSRFRHGVAAAAMLPAIFVMVPSGLAASGSLVQGLTSANQITHNVTGISIVNNGTQGFIDAQNATASTTSVYSGTIFNVGYGMVQVAIGISVGLFLSSLIIYPLGKKRSGIFSF